MNDNLSMATIYLPLTKFKSNTPNQSWVKNIKTTVSNLINGAKLNLSQFNLNGFSKNFVSQCKTDTVIAYSAEVLSRIAQGQPVNSIALDLFFDAYAPVLNMKCLQMGFNSINQMKTAIKSGQIVDSAVFLQGLSDALNIINQNPNINSVYKRYGENLDINVVSRCNFDLSVSESAHTFKNRINTMQYNLRKNVINQIYQNTLSSFVNPIVSPLYDIKMNFEGHIHNENGDLVKSNDIMQKLAYCMSHGILIAMRVGKDVYENCLVEFVHPEIVDAYDLKLNMRLKIPYNRGFSNMNIGISSNI